MISLPRSQLYTYSPAASHSLRASVYIPCTEYRSMRFPSIPTFIRTFSVYNFASIRALPASYRGIQSPFLRNTTILSMPTIPFIGSIFSKPKDMTNYPVKKSDDEWQVVLSPRAFEVIREKDTQSSYDSTFDQHMPSEGVYVCSTVLQSYYPSIPQIMVSPELKKKTSLTIISLTALPSL